MNYDATSSEVSDAGSGETCPTCHAPGRLVGSSLKNTAATAGAGPAYDVYHCFRCCMTWTEGASYDLN